ncbi:MAG TPA: septation ring formation regulator EzrA [Erysipelothrix sp.]
MNYNDILEFLNQNKIIIAVIFAVIILVIFFLMRSSKKRKLKHRFDEIEIKYNELMSIPILFKINKAVGLAKINQSLAKDVDICNNLFETVRELQDDLVQQIGDADDALAYGKLKEADELFTSLESLIEESMEKTYLLDQKLETLLEEETQQRLQINEQKNVFRDLKRQAKASEMQLGESYPLIQSDMQDIEHLFSNFEEWMYASNFQKAAEVSEQAKASIEVLEAKINAIPKLYERAKGYIPELLDEVSRLYQGVKQEGVFVEHLEVPRNIGILSEVLKEDLLHIAQGHIDKSAESLTESEKRLEQLVLEIQKEATAHQEVETIYAELSSLIESLGYGVGELEKEAQRIEERFDFPGFEEQVEVFKQRLLELQARDQNIHRMLHEEAIPASSILLSVKELDQDTRFLFDDFKKEKEKAEQANADEVRARKQLLKLHLIINDVQVRIKNRSLPSISEKYQDDLKKSYGYTDQIKAMLEQTTLNVSLLNATVDEAIDYIYKLHNNVNNLVGVVDMCENAIVYANKFRAFVPDIDAELTRAELAFNNGEYTQSLTTIINSIDRFRPNTEYEEMIRENARSAQ